jgi:hypothetical protein
MKKSVLLILLGKRKDSAVKVQSILTGWGCIIKTRLGIHDGVLDDCSDNGLLILELVGDASKNTELADRIKLVEGVAVRLVELSVDETEKKD